MVVVKYTIVRVKGEWKKRKSMSFVVVVRCSSSLQGDPSVVLYCTVP